MSPRNHNLIGRLLSTLLGLCLLLTASMGQAMERVTFYHNDALGSPVAATDATGTLLWRESYAPYGKRLTQEAGSKDTVWYTGKPEEAAFGLSYFGARWYDPTIGRFLAMDPAGFDPDNIHSFGRYAYANDNPYAYVDPDGKTPLLALVINPGTEAILVNTFNAITASLVVYGGYLGLNNLFNESTDGADNVPDLPGGLVGVQDDKSGVRGKRHVSGPLSPEYGGTGNADDDFDHLTGGSGKPAPDGYPEGTKIGDNGITIRPGTDRKGPRIDIPSKGGKPHETLHY